MRWQNTGIVACHSATKTRQWLKNVPVERIQFAEDTDRIFEDKLQKVRTGYFTKKIWKTRSTDQRPDAAERKTCITEKNGTTVDELLDPVSQEDQKQTYLSTRQILKEMVLTQCSIIQIIRCNLSLKWFVRLPMWLLPVASFSYIYILQGSIATQLKCGEIFNNCFIANCP